MARLSLVSKLRHLDHLDPIDETTYMSGLAGHCGRISGALQCILAAPKNADVRALGQEVMDDFNRWRKEQNQ